MSRLLRRLLTLMVAAALFGVATAARPGSNTDVVPDGYYYPENLPASFAPVTYLELWTSKPGPPPDYAPIATPLFGRLLIGRSSLKLARVSIDGRALSFETVAVRDTAYTFKGTFLRGGDLSAQDVEGVVLKGELAKVTAGKSAESAGVAFTFSVGD